MLFDPQSITKNFSAADDIFQFRPCFMQPKNLIFQMADDSHDISSFIFPKTIEMSQNLSPAACMIGALMVSSSLASSQLLSADNLCKQFEPRSGLTKRQS